MFKPNNLTKKKKEKELEPYHMKYKLNIEKCTKKRTNKMVTVTAGRVGLVMQEYICAYMCTSNHHLFHWQNNREIHKNMR